MALIANASLPMAVQAIVAPATAAANATAIVVSANAFDATAGGRRRLVGCLQWHQTAGCTAAGPLEPSSDAACNATISGERSGFCLCRDHRRAAAVDCGHPPLTCEEACRQRPRQRRTEALRPDDHLEDARVVTALGYSALLALGDRAAASALISDHRTRRRRSLFGVDGQRPVDGSGLIPLKLYQTIDRTDRPGLGEEWRASDGDLVYLLHDDVLGQRYLNLSWGPRFARAFGQVSMGAIRSDVR